MPVTLFVLGVLAAGATALAVWRVRRPALLSFPIAMIGWLAGELAVFHIVLQVLVTGLLVAFGALDSTIGWVGLVLMALSVAGLIHVQSVAGRARGVLTAALAPLDPTVELATPRLADLIRPFHQDRTGIVVERDVAYGSDARHKLDIYRPADHSGPPRPVLLYLHGGAWITGNKKDQGLPLLHAAVRHGYVGVTVNYRLAPKHRYPAAVHDVKSALAWIHQHISEHGGDPGFVAVSGGSAGGHLAALLALTPNQPELQPGFEDGDTTINACAPVYGAFDFTDRFGVRGKAAMGKFLEKRVMSSTLLADRPTWEAASPIYIVGKAAPPFFVIHGTHDVLIYCEESREFVRELRAVSTSPVLHAEVPGAHHSFDLFKSVRTAATVDAVLAFLDAVRTQSQSAGSAGSAV